MKVFDAIDLHKRTGWRLEDCDEMITQLNDNGLSVLDTLTITKILDFQNRMEDDRK